MASSALITQAQNLAKASVEDRAKLLSQWKSARNHLQRIKKSGHNTTDTIIKSGASLAAGAITGYFWGKNSTTDYKPVANIPIEWIGAAAGLAAGLFNLGGPKISGVLANLGDGFLAIGGLKAGMKFGKGKLAFAAVAGEEYSGLDDGSSGVDPDL